MAASIIAQIAEESRKISTGDKRYADKGHYVFVLNGPPLKESIGESGRAQFPLIINPMSFEYTLPFAAELTALQEGGVVSEESGFVIGDISLSGITGFKIRKPLGDTSYRGSSDGFTSSMGGGFSEDASAIAQGISGQMHFWRLANRCFGAYSELKKSPKFAAETSMEFHVTKDDLHLLVVPREFRLTREASTQRVTYKYSIKLAVVGVATSGPLLPIPSPDVGLLQGFKNTIGKIRNAVQSVQAAINDITASLDEIRRTITSVASILDDAIRVQSAANDLLTGVKKFIDIPAVAITSAARLAESAAFIAANTASFPKDVAQSFRRIADGLDRIRVASRDHFRENFPEIYDAYSSVTRGHQEGKDPARDTQASTLNTLAANSQGRLSVQTAFGSSVRPGDVVLGKKESLRSRERFRAGSYSGFEEKIVSQGDTLPSLAARYMGDAREWPAIAIANQLKPPYITAGAKLPGTVSLGDRITIPIPNTNQIAPDTLTTGARASGKSQAESFWGREFELVQIGSKARGWAVNKSFGSVDVQQVAGEDNLIQAISMRFLTEQGQNVLYPQYGLPRIVGNNGLGDVLDNANYEARRQLLSDPRIVAVSSLSIVNDQDSLKLSVDVQPTGSSTSRVIARTLT